MRCRDVASDATRLLERASDDAVSVALRAHVAECPGCQRYLAQLRLTLRALRTLGGPAPERPVRESLLAAFRAQKKRVRGCNEIAGSNTEQITETVAPPSQRRG